MHAKTHDDIAHLHFCVESSCRHEWWILVGKDVGDWPQRDIKERGPVPVEDAIRVLEEETRSKVEKLEDLLKKCLHTNGGTKLTIHML